MNSYIDVLKEYGIEHPSRNMRWEELIEGLWEEMKRGNVKASYHPDYQFLAIYKYTTLNPKEWSVFRCMARGLILDLKDRKIVATPFMKTFHYNQLGGKANNEMKGECFITKKIQGRMVVMFNYNKQWMASTTDSFTHPVAKVSEDWFQRNLDLEKIDPKNTYLFIMRYKHPVLVGIIDSFGLEYNYEFLSLEAGYMGVECAPLCDFDESKHLSSNRNEEYIIHFNGGLRVNI